MRKGPWPNTGAEKSAEDLGRIGEREFETLCARAGIACNPSRVDLTGWDFFVELPAPSSANTPLDHRRPFTAHVQLKTTSNTTVISLKLSAAELLAKRAGPSIIVVFTATKEGEILEGHLIDLLGNPLERILKRLRIAEFKGETDLSHKTIRFNYREQGAQFAATPDGIASALYALCESPGGAYEDEKLRQLRELGYEVPGLIEMKAMFWIKDALHFNRVLLGVEPIKPELLQAFDTRFGLSIPYTGPVPNSDSVYLEPAKVGDCFISIRPGSGQAAVTFEADMYTAPNLVGTDTPPMLIKNDFFQILAHDAGDNIALKANFTMTSQPLAEWQKRTRALAYMAGGCASFSLTLNLGDRPTLTAPTTGMLEGPQTDEMPRINAVLEGWFKILELAGLLSRQPFSYEDLWSRINELALVVDLLQNPAPVAKLEIEEAASYADFETIEVLLVNAFEFIDCQIHYSMRVTFSKVGASFKSSQFEVLSILPGRTDIDRFASQEADRNGLYIVINQADFPLVHC